MVVARHVDEVDQHDAAQVAQPQLPRDGLGGFEVRLEDRVVEVARADKAASVHIDRRERLGLVDHQVAARLQFHPSTQCPDNFVVDRIEVEHRALAGVMLQLCDGLRHEFVTELLQHVELLQRVDADGLRRIDRHVAQHALQQAQVLVQQRDGGQPRRQVTDACPCLAQVGDVFRELDVGRILAVGAQDVAAGMLTPGRSPVSNGRSLAQGLQSRAQGIALGRWNFLRDADVVVLWQEHQQPTGDADLGRQPRALGPDRILDDLHQ